MINSELLILYNVMTVENLLIITVMIIIFYY